MFQGGVNQFTSMAANSGGAVGGTSRTGMGLVNPIIASKTMGDYMLDGIGALMLVGAVDKVAPIGVVGKVVGAATNAMGKASSKMGALAGKLALGDMFMSFMLACVVLAFFLAIYIPMIPAMVWFSAITHWLLSVVEFIFIAPLLSFAHLMEGDEGLGGATQNGYMFIMNLLLRPVLLVIGFMFASGILIALGTFLVYFYGIMVRDADTNTTTGFLSMLGYCSLFVIMLVGMVNKVFEVCLLTLPSQIFAAIGGHFAGMSGDHEKHGHTFGGVISRAQGATGIKTQDAAKKAAAPAADQINKAVNQATNQGKL